MNITLQPKDIPGGLLKKNYNIEDHSVQELKRWLEVRGLKRSGNKVELIQRVSDCIRAKKDRHVDVSIDCGKWYDLKRKNIVTDQEKNAIPFLPVSASGWGQFPSIRIPMYFNKGHMYFYMYEQCSELAGTVNDNTTVKPMRRAELYCDSSHVYDVKDFGNEDFYFLKCHVKASFNTETSYNTTCTLSQGSSAVIDATCDCKQSALGRCSHVASLLLFLLDHVTENGYDAITCTMQPCQWGQGSKKRNPMKAQDARYTKRHSKQKSIERIEFDPRPRGLINPSNYTIGNLWQELHLQAKLDHRTSPIMWELLVSLPNYPDFELDHEEICIILKLVTLFYENYYDDKANYQVHELCSALIVPNSDNQSDDINWHLSRRIIMSASICKTVIHFTTPRAIMNFLRARLWNIGCVQTAGMKYGSDNEDIARKEFQRMYPEYIVYNIGLLLDIDCPQLGCSLDSIAKHVFTNEIIGVEIKCFPTLKNCHPKDFDTHLSKQQLSRFCLKKTKQGLEIKTNSYIYYQIQMQLGITKLKTCMLVLWSPRGILTLPVTYNNDFWMSCKEKLLDFHSEYLVPEFFLMRTPRNLYPLKISHFAGITEHALQ